MLEFFLTKMNGAVYVNPRETNIVLDTIQFVHVKLTIQLVLIAMTGQSSISLFASQYFFSHLSQERAMQATIKSKGTVLDAETSPDSFRGCLYQFFPCPGVSNRTLQILLYY